MPSKRSRQSLKEIDQLTAELKIWCQSGIGGQKVPADELGVRDDLLSNWFSGRKRPGLKNFNALQAFPRQALHQLNTASGIVDPSRSTGRNVKVGWIHPVANQLHGFRFVLNPAQRSTFGFNSVGAIADRRSSRTFCASINSPAAAKSRPNFSSGATLSSSSNETYVVMITSCLFPQTSYVVPIPW